MKKSALVPCRSNPGNFNGFSGTTDIAFAPNGHVFISDGDANARVLEYTRDGMKVREWAAAGRGPGQFRPVHSIHIDDSGVVYVSDPETEGFRNLISKASTSASGTTSAGFSR